MIQKYLSVFFLFVIFLFTQNTYSQILSGWTFDGVTTTNTGATWSATAPEAQADDGVLKTGSLASGVHVSASTGWTLPAGNGSGKALSSNQWGTTGDVTGNYYQFLFSTTGYSGISVTWDQTGSTTGPRDFKVQYSTNGSDFTDATGTNSTYSLTAESWSSTTLPANLTSRRTLDLSSVTALDNQSTVYIRLVQTSTTSINGATVGTAGTNRLDNFIVTAGPYDLPFEQAFSIGTYLPAGWHANMIVLANHGTAGSNGLTRNLWGSATTGFAQTPSIGIGPLTSTAQLEFDYRIVNWDGYPSTPTAIVAGDVYTIQISSDGGSTFTTEYTIDHTNHVTSTNFAKVVVPLGGYEGNSIVVRWNLTRAAGDYYFDIDNVFVREPLAGAPDPAVLVSPLDAAVNVLISASLNWTAGSGALATGYKINFGTNDPPTNIENGTDLGLVTTYTPASPLAYSTTYYWEIIPYNGDGDATGTTVWSFTTIADPTITSFPFTETFEDDSPSRSKWTQIQVAGSGSWTYATGAGGGLITTAYEGTRNARFVSVSGTNSPITKLVSPPMDLSSLTAPRVVFYYGQEFWSPTTNETKVYYRISITDPWVEIAHYTANISSWTQVILALPNPSANYQIAFEGINNWGRANVIDFVTVEESPAGAPDPAVLVSPLDAAINVLISTSLNWTAGGGALPTGYKINFGTNDPPTNIENGTDLGLVTTYTPASPLAYSTTYYWEIIPYNGDGDATGTTVWSFTTMADPTIATFPYEQGFEGVTFPPLGWQNYGTKLWSTGSEANSGTKAARVSFTPSGSAHLEMPPVDLPASPHRIKFWWKDDDISARYGNSGFNPEVANYDTTYFEISTDGGDTWTVLSFLSAPSNMGSYVEELVNLAPYANQTVNLRWRDVVVEGASTNAWGIGLDDITIEEALVGTLSGVVTDCFTTNEIEGVNVSIGILNTTTDEDGFYEFLDIPAGTYDITASFAGYVNTTIMDVEVLNGQTTTQNICLNEFLDPPVSLQANVTGQNVQLTWLAPGSTPTSFEDSFESYSNFTTSFSPWLNIDVDGGGTWGWDGYTWPGSGTAQAFMVFNTSATTPSNPTNYARTGNKFLACFSTLTASAPNNDWLISPKVEVITGSMLKFWARSIVATYGLERFRVGVSTTGTDPGDFTIISAGPYVEAPITYTEYTYDLSAYVGQEIYVAINCVSNDAFFMLLDDFSIGVPSESEMIAGQSKSIMTNLLNAPIHEKDLLRGNNNSFTKVMVTPDYTTENSVTGKNELNNFKFNSGFAPEATFTGYNVYRDEVKIANNIADLFYNDNALDPGVYNYEVTAQYLEGESQPLVKIVEIITCPVPTGLTATNITETSADLSWTPGGDETEWEYVYGLFPLDEPTGSGTSTANSTVSVTDLSSNTVYQFYVRSMCGGSLGPSTWAGPYTFATPCGAFNLPFTETFETTSSTIGCWLVANMDGGGINWGLSTAQNHTPSGNRSAYHGFGTSGYNEDGWLITPALNIPVEGSVSLSFWSYNSFPTWYWKNSVLVSTGSPDPGDEDYVEIWTTESVTSTWEETILDLSSYAGQVIYVAFRYEGDDAHGWYLDDVSVSGPTASTFQLTVGVDNGWNMVSIPGLHPVDQGVDTWWAGRDGTANVFGYVGGYNPVTEVAPGKGYWMKHLGEETYNTGDEWPTEGITFVPHDPIPANEGWNLVGGYEEEVLISAITTDPGVISATIYGYASGGYTEPTLMVPGKAYWIKVSAEGDIIIPSGESNKGTTKIAGKNEKQDWGRIVITDNAGRSYTLYAAKEGASLSKYELPPLPPAGMFDIRFNSGRFVENISSSSQMIDMSGVEYPVKVRAENIAITIQDVTGKIVDARLKAGEEVTISNSTIQKLIVMENIIPDVYSLEQNYPNPFNPSTIIEFSIPEDASNVSLIVYDALGQKVAELINGGMEAGKYSFNWNASNLASGLYIYELRANKFVSIKKMLLLK